MGVRGLYPDYSTGQWSSLGSPERTRDRDSIFLGHHSVLAQSTCPRAPGGRRLMRVTPVSDRCDRTQESHAIGPAPSSS